MSRIDLPPELNVNRYPSDPGTVQKLINLTQDTWHAAFAGGAGDIDESTAFTDPDPAEADRIPELALTATGTPGDYTITGTWNGEAQTEVITTVADDTVKGWLPFDTITRFQGPDPGAGEDVTLYAGDSYADPPARALWSGDADGVPCVQLSGEADVQEGPTVPAQRDWPRRIVRIEHDRTTLVAPWFVW